MLRVAVAQYASDGVAIRYVLPVFWTTSYIFRGQWRESSTTVWTDAGELGECPISVRLVY